MRWRIDFKWCDAAAISSLVSGSAAVICGEIRFGSPKMGISVVYAYSLTLGVLLIALALFTGVAGIWRASPTMRTLAWWGIALSGAACSIFVLANTRFMF